MEKPYNLLLFYRTIRGKTCMHVQVSKEDKLTCHNSYNNYFICDQIYGYCSIEMNKIKTDL